MNLSHLVNRNALGSRRTFFPIEPKQPEVTNHFRILDDIIMRSSLKIVILPSSGAGCYTRRKFGFKHRLASFRIESVDSPLDSLSTPSSSYDVEACAKRCHRTKACRSFSFR